MVMVMVMVMLMVMAMVVEAAIKVFVVAASVLFCFIFLFFAFFVVSSLQEQNVAHLSLNLSTTIANNQPNQTHLQISRLTDAVNLLHMHLTVIDDMAKQYKASILRGR